MKAYKYKTQVNDHSEVVLKDVRLLQGQSVEVIIMIPETEEAYEEEDWTALGLASFEEEWNHPENNVWDQFYEEQQQGNI